ncbi:general odorant-binding protein 84a [Anastrepha obliqua]|uniref:general odorant-binding protein 84a n=1 Tax=Anastrepha obliqua TaxID=95512 RepID=UPI0024096E69|nr:general odorant-binding protein 84a [Anastrepha obliqua]
MAKSNAFNRLIFLLVLCCCKNLVATQKRAKDNGDIYVQHKEQVAIGNNSSVIDVEEVMQICNASFSVPMEYIVQFNTTGELSDTTDKTGMCFIRCFFEKSGLIKDWQLNTDLIMQNIMPITTSSVQFCESEAKNEMNACVRTYAIAKCLMKSVLENARNNTTV